MDFHEWYNLGVSQKWCSAVYCETHDGAPLNDEEMEAFDNGEDPCVFAVRLIEPETDQ